MLIRRVYRKPFFYAISLHVLLLTALCVNFVNHHSYTERNNNVQIVHATVVSQAEVNHLLADIQAEKRRKLEIARAAQLEKIHQQELVRQKHELKIQKALALKAERLEKNNEQKIARIHKAQVLAREQYHEKLDKQMESRRLALQQAMQQQLAQESKQIAAVKQQEQLRLQSIVDKYKAMIIQAIAERWIVPDNVSRDISCQFLIDVAPGGTVLSVTLLKSSGDPVLDRSARTAVLKASPLPMPKDPHVFNSFRELRLTVRPEKQ